MSVLRTLARIWTNLLILAALLLALGLVARCLLPAAPWAESPTVSVSSPVDGAVDVLPRSEVRLRFSIPMNRDSTLDALRIVPPTSGGFRWSDDVHQLTFIPETTLIPATDYTITVSTTALGRWFLPLAAPRQIRFRTASLPAVVAALPNSADTSLDGAIVVVFSQAMVPADTLDQPVELPQLRIDPPMSAQVRWLNQTTLLIRADAPLRAATHYTATIAPDLTDLRGVDLGQSYRWSWSTAWPTPMSLVPARGARWVSPHQPLVLTLSAPLDESLLHFMIDPPVQGQVTSAIISTTQVITFTPQVGWEYGRSYHVSLATNPSLAAPPDLAWRFSVEPQPGLIAFFPGQGQALPVGQEVRLIFNTPMDEVSLRAGLRIDPPVVNVPMQVNETEVRLRPILRPSITYTLTVDADTPDRSGEPLGVTATVHLRTAPAEPSLRVPDAITHVISLPTSRTAQIVMERINLSRLVISLYRIDTPTVVRATGLTPAEWRDFSPERYGQALARNWQLPLTDPADTLAHDPISVTLADGAPLVPGIYYLRAISPEGPRADVILAVSSVALTLRQNESQVLVWATDKASGTPVAGVPLTIYDGDTLITHGVTGADGVWQQPILRPAGSAAYLVIAEGAAPTLVRNDWRVAASGKVGPRSRSLIFLDRLDYRPGDRVQIGGFARILTDGAMALPAASTPCRMNLKSDETGTLGPSAACEVTTTGMVSGTLPLASLQPPGDYRLLVHAGDSTADLGLHISADATPIHLHLSSASGGQVIIKASQDELPLVGSTISWTLALEPLAMPANREGFHVATDLPAPRQISGSGITDGDGQLAVPLSVREAAQAQMRYRLRAELRVPNERPASGQIAGVIQPTNDRVGLRLPSRVVLSNERATVDLLALAADGGAAANRQIGVAVYRRGTTNGRPLITRSATSNAQGRADVQLVQLNPGAYEIVASLGTSSSSMGLWVTGGHYTGWQNGPRQVDVVPDRDSYRPGDVARLLVTAPFLESNLLLTTERGSLRSVDVRDLGAGQTITLTITPDMAPAISIGAVVSSGAERLSGNAAILVSNDHPAPTVAIVADSSQYAPSGTAILTITSSLAGTPSATLIAIAPAESPDNTLALAQFTPPPIPPSETAMLVPDATTESIPSATTAALIGGEGYVVLVAGDANQTVVRVPLPDSSGRWRVSAYAVAGGDQFAVGTTIITTSLPLELTPTAPPSLRPGDHAEVSLRVRNTSLVTQSLQVQLHATGGDIESATPGDQQILLAPGAAQQVAWRISPRTGVSVVSLRYAVTGANLSEQIIRDLPVMPDASATTPSAGGATISQEYLDPLSGARINPDTLHVGQIIALRVMVINARPHLRGSVEIALPSTLQPIALELPAPFIHAEPIRPSARSLRVEAATISPGVYTLSVTARVATIGTFRAPGARLILDEAGMPSVVAAPSPALIVGSGLSP